MRPEPANDAVARPVAPRGRRLGWAVELAVLFAAILVFREFLGSALGLGNASPHVFWIPVVAMAVCYGIPAGLCAALVATGLVVWETPRLSPAEADSFVQWAHLWHQPMLWLLAALLLGAHREREMRRRNDAERRAGHAEERSETITAYAASLREHIARLEREIVHAPRLVEEDGAHAARVLPFARPEANANAHRHHAERKP